MEAFKLVTSDVQGSNRLYRKLENYMLLSLQNAEEFQVFYLGQFLALFYQLDSTREVNQDLIKKLLSTYEKLVGEPDFKYYFIQHIGDLMQIMKKNMYNEVLVDLLYKIISNRIFKLES